MSQTRRLDSDAGEQQLALPETKPAAEMQPIPAAALSPVPQLPVLTEEDVKRAEKGAGLARRITLASVKITHEMDWSNYDGEPYLDDQGTDKLAMLWGVTIYCDGIFEDRREDDKGRYIIYTARGRGERQGREVEVIGTATTRNPFYSRAKGKDVPLEDIDLTRVKKHSYSNMHQHAVKRLIGLRAITWSDLEAVLGKEAVDRIKGRAVGHAGSDRSQGDTSSEAEVRQGLKVGVLILAGGDPELATKLLMEATSFKGKEGNLVAGKRRVEELSPKAAEVTYGKIREDVAAKLVELGPEKAAALQAKIAEYLALK